MHLAEGGADRRDVAAVAVDEEEAVEAVARQRDDDVAHHQDERRRPERDGAGEGHVMLRHADRYGRRDQGAGLLAHAREADLPGERVGADQPGRAVLLGRADRHDDPGAPLEIGFDLGPGGKLKLHAPDLLPGPGRPSAAYPPVGLVCRFRYDTIPPMKERRRSCRGSVKHG